MSFVLVRIDIADAKFPKKFHVDRFLFRWNSRGVVFEENKIM